MLPFYPSYVDKSKIITLLNETVSYLDMLVDRGKIEASHKTRDIGDTR
ncbi:hypothetical protein C2W64_03974 [Brevibacillus laterosporus]|nr:hypothetical protein C2W64_03974 [Brevibacillus laterosporus]